MHIWLLQSTRHIKEVKNRILRHKWIFRHTCKYKQPTLTMSWNCNIFVQIFYSFFRQTVTLFLGCALFLLLAVIVSELYEKPRRNKNSLQNKIHKRICVRDITGLTARLPFFVICFFLRLLPLPSQVKYLLNGPYKGT